MKKRFAMPAAFLLCWIASPSRGGDLTIGDRAPKIEVAEFVKGQPVKGFEKGKTYVVEFWATWCGPCKTSIPHLTELQKKHKDATFLGVSLFEQDFSQVKPFVQEMGDKMAYTVATDSVPEGKDAQDGVMGKTWMEAAGENGIPAAFIVNGEGKIAWIGHPMNMDKPLEQILAGTWNVKSAREGREREKAAEKKIAKAMESIENAREKGDKALLNAIDDADAEGVSLPPFLAKEKLLILAKAPETKERALSYGKGLIEGAYKDEPIALNDLARSLVAPENGKAEPDLAKLGLKAALRADELVEKKDAAIADTLAKAYFETGNVAKALETQERASKLAEGIEGIDISEIKDRLEQYRRAAKTGNPK